MKSTSKTTNTPKLRFPEFTDDWEIRKLGEISEKVKEKNKNREFIETLTNSAELGVISQRDFFDKEISNIDNITNYYIVQHNDFIYNPRISNLAPVGPIKRNKLGRTGVMSPLYYVFRLNSDVEPSYLEIYFETKIWHKFMYLNGDTGARSDRFAIKDNIFVQMPIMLPSIKEQTTIGNFFRQLDKLIALHQGKLDKVKTLKKGLLQKMFPAQGETVPQIRFPQFTDDWEIRKLGDCFSERSERSVDGELISVTINSGVIKANELDRKDNSSQDKSNYKKVEIDDIAYNSMRMWQGACGVSAYSGILSPAYTVLKPRKGINSEFFAYSFKLERTLYLFKMYSQGLTSDTWNLKYPLLKDISTYVPSYEEQTTIGNFFRQFDDLINLHQRKLEHLKTLKKALLQQMFV